MDSPIRRFTKQHSHINNEIQMCRPATRRSSFNFGFNCSRENIRIHLANQPRTQKEHRCVSSTAKSRFLFCYFVSFHENIRILCKMKTQNKGRQDTHLQQNRTKKSLFHTNPKFNFRCNCYCRVNKRNLKCKRIELKEHRHTRKNRGNNRCVITIPSYVVFFAISRLV